MRGEYVLLHTTTGVRTELPPHARRILRLRFLQGRTQGTTSACAENTCHSFVRHGRLWNYLRMRGEYNQHDIIAVLNRELPPHARRIHPITWVNSLPLGTTSACAENTTSVWQYGYPPGNYLRMRGEYITDRDHGFDEMELPPHARRILPGLDVKQITTGTTSACAENTYRSF